MNWSGLRPSTPISCRRSSNAPTRNFADCLLQINGKTEVQANNLADTILKDAGRFDIIAINEAWDEDAKSGPRRQAEA